MLIGSIFRSITTLGFIMISMTCAKAEPLRFVIVGDMPYNESQTLLFEDKIVPAAFPSRSIWVMAAAIARMLVLHVPTRSSPC